MTADEMFEKLGFDEIEKTDFYITYKGYEDCFVINFDLEDKTVCTFDMEFGIETLKAINKKCEELGWYD